jgi:hypothetical protein
MNRDAIEEGGQFEVTEQGSAEHLERIQQTLKIRDAKQSELFRLLQQPERLGNARTDVWDAWMELQVAQNDLDMLVKGELLRHLGQ